MVCGDAASQVSITSCRLRSEPHPPERMFGRSAPPDGSLHPSSMLAGLSADLDVDGILEEFGQRLCGVLAALGEGHFKCFTRQGDRRNMYLQQV